MKIQVLHPKDNEDEIQLMPESKSERLELERLRPPYKNVSMGWMVYSDRLCIVAERNK